MGLTIQDFEDILNVGIQLTTEKDYNKILNTIIEKGMQITKCDASTLYLYEDGVLKFRIMRTISQGISRGVDGTPITDIPPVPFKEENVCAYTAIHRKVINIADVYDSEEFDFSGPKRYDAMTGFRTQSMLVIPIEDNAEELIGVLQMINAQDENGTVIPFDHQFEIIIRSLGSLAAIEMANIRYINNLAAITAEKERINAELNIATQIQADMLPNVFPAFPEYEEFDIYASMIPAKEVGGDFYDMFMVDKSHLAIVIADVSGKGVPAALFMVIAKTLIKNQALNKENPSQIFTSVNNQLCENNEVGMFVTGWMGIMDIFTGHMDYVNAGHNYPLVIRRDGTVEWIKSKPGFVLAGMEGVRYRQNELQLEEGDTIYLYTDGVTEALNTSQELFGDKRLEKILLEKNVKEMKPKMLLKKIAKELKEFSKEAEQADDITMLALHRNIKEKISEKILKIKAKKEEWDKVNNFLEMQLEKAECSLKVQTQILIAAEEIFVNIVSYAYNEEGGMVEIKVEIDPNKRLKIEFLDSGIPYNPLERENPDITLNAEERNIGGLGIFMVKKIMDDVLYEYKDGKNCLILLKNI